MRGDNAMSEKYLSIAEFAKRANVSPQSIYQRLKRQEDEIHKYTKTKSGKTVIAERAINEIYNKHSDDYEETQDTETQTTITEILLKQVETLTTELEAKNKIIAELQEQIKQYSEREDTFQTLLLQQQQLTAVEKKNVILLEEKTEKKRKGIFGIFRKKEEEKAE